MLNTSPAGTTMQSLVTRPGGRAANSLRPLMCELSCLENSDGSASFQSGATTVLASVQGPVAPRLTQHEKESAVVSVVVKSGPINKTYEFEWEDILTNVLSRAIVTEAYPRSVIQVVIQIVTADGSVLAASLHAAVSALMDAGIDLRYLPTAVTCLLPDKTPTTVMLDPSADEEQTGGTIVLMTLDDVLLASHTSNVEASVETVLQCCSVAFRARPAITSFWRLAWEQKVSREAQTLWST